MSSSSANDSMGTNLTLDRLGYAWHCCGLIHAQMGLAEASIDAYNKAYVNYKQSVGPLYHRTGNVCDKIAEYHASLKQYEAAE